MAKTNAERQAEFRANLELRGGKQIAPFLTPSAYEKLLAWHKKGETTDSLINRLLEESQPETD